MATREERSLCEGKEGEQILSTMHPFAMEMAWCTASIDFHCAPKINGRRGCCQVVAML